MDISSPVGGGKYNMMVKQIINAEREPIRLIEGHKAKENEKLKLVQEFVGKVRKLPEALKDLENFRKFRELKADLPPGAKDICDVSLDKEKAEPGEYQIEVDQLAGKHSMISDGYESADDEIGVGYFNYETANGDSKSVWIGPGHDTLRGLVSAINNEKGCGVQASIVNDGSGSDRPWRIVVQGKKSGSDNDLAFPDFYFLDGDFRFYVDDERDAQNAIIKFNGFEILSQSNKFELLPGVTLDLKGAKEDYEFTLNITEDVPKMAAKLKGLIDAINGVFEFVNKQNTLDANSDTSKTLGGDTALLTIQERLRRLMFQEFGVDDDDEDVTMRVSDAGIQFEKTGQLSFKEDKFKKMLDTDFDHIVNLFTGEGNFIDQVKYIANGFLAPDTGPVSTREKGIRDRIRAMDDQIANKERQLDRREQQLKRQFSQLEGLTNNMQNQQAYIAQAMGGGGLIPGT